MFLEGRHSQVWENKNYWLGWVAITIYAFFWLIDLDISRIGESIFVLCFVIAWCVEPERKIKYNKIFILLVVLVFLQIGVYQFAADRFPEFADDQIKTSRHWAKLFLCISVAWWIKGSIKAAAYLLAILGVGFFCSLLVGVSAQEWLTGIQGQRVDLNYKNAQHSAVYCGLMLLLGLFGFFQSIIKDKNYLYCGLYIIIIFISGVGVIITQTRAVWIAIVATLFIVSLVAVFYSLKSKQRPSSATKAAMLAICFVLVLIVGATFSNPSFTKRLGANSEAVVQVLQGNLQEIPYNGAGVRLHTWVYALDKIVERPLIGWGSQSRKPLIDEGPFPTIIKERFGHFHNSYIELALAYGLIGFIIFSWLTFFIIKGIFRLKNTEHFLLFLGLLSSFIFFAIVNFFESYLIFRTGMYFYILVGGIGMSFYLFGVNGDRRQST